MRILQTTIILSLVALILTIINYKKTGRHSQGFKLGFKQLIQMAPIIIGAFILAGIIEVLIPQEFVRNWLSTEAGFRGIILGTFGGMILAMGPYAFFPIVASIMSSGAGLGTIISMLTGWSLLSLTKMPFETAFLGIKFFIIRMSMSIPLSLMAGFLAFFLEGLVY